MRPLDFIIILVFTGINSATAQNTINGIITDTDNFPLPFANVILYQDNVETPINAVASDENGAYLFGDIEAGTYKIEVSMLGFETKRSEIFTLTNKEKIRTFNFSLLPEQLEEVVINYKKPVIIQTAEKMIVDIEQSEMINTSLQDVMKKVPGVIVSNGSISYAGQSGIRILINGKSTDYMDIATLLREMPADNIARVELVQQPGAEYDAEGSGPLINIILKKNIKLGTHGNIKVTGGYDNDWLYTSSVSISSYENKLNWQASAGYSQNSWREDLQISRRVLDETYDQTSISPFTPESLNLSAGLDYYLNDHNTLGITTRTTESSSKRVTKNTTVIGDTSTSQTLLTDNSYDKQMIFYVLNPYFEYRTDKTKLILDFNYVNYDSANENNLFQIGQSTIPYNDQRYFQDAEYDIFTYQGDYQRDLSKNVKLSLGAKYTSVNSDSNLESLIQNDQGIYENNENQTNNFNIDETISAVYGKVNMDYGKWMFSGGLRWEESNTEGTSVTLNETIDRNISKFFPSVSINREITDEIDVNIGYSYRIDRPSYSSLNSFVYYYDPYTFEEGNPSLKPSLTNSLQFNVTYDKQPFFTVTYQKTSDELFQILSQNDATAEASRSTINLANNENWSFRLFGPLNFIKRLDGFTGIIANYNQYNSENLSPALDLSKWSVTWYTSASYKLPWDINSELSGYYTSGGLDGQIEYDWLAGLDIALSKSFMKDQLKVNLQWEEILDRKFYGGINYNNINADIISNWSRRNIILQLNYSFGSQYSKKKKRKEASENEMERIDTKN